MERLKIFIGLIAIAGAVAVFGERAGTEEEVAAKPVVRSFSSDGTSARFVPAAPRD